MSQEFKTFLQQNVSNTSGQFLQKLEQGFARANRTESSIKAMRQAVMEVSKASNAWDWADFVLDVLEKQCLQVKPAVRDAMFFPNESSLTRLISYLDKAQISMRVCVFTITNNSLRDALTRAWNRGVDVKVISDDECMNQQGSDVQALADIGIPTTVDPNPNAHMHNKFVVIDNYILITGSFNWTVAAVSNNQENLIALSDPVLAQMYSNEFDKLFSAFSGKKLMSRDEAATKIQKTWKGKQARDKYSKQ